MILNKHTLAVVLTVLVLMGSSFYYTQFKPVIQLDNETLSTTIDTSILQLSVKKFNELGELSSLMTTPRMEHIPKNNVHLLQTPHVVIKEKNQPDWEIKSRQATSINGGHTITFSQKVVMRQRMANGTQESKLKTEEITYYPKQKKATTNLFVTFEQPGNTIQSTGMNAYLDEKRVELLHGAQGSYAPNTQG
ncbi:MAG: LPS export ABC transporter periplasmic protein LptC [Legionella sp.]|nr:MAG: LPS export ABC transporter periplasmic protein LptC [Legionella sp.]PJD99586.1 MAG: LPS export ABC transporter periplasmic protein LptC [Legionella sp.]